MKRILIIIVILISCISIQAQFIHSIELNNGIAVSKLDNNNSNNQFSYEQLYFNGISSAINLNYLNHNYWNLCSQLAYQEIGQKTAQNTSDYPTSNIVKNYSVFYFNLLSFSTLFELKYPNKYIVPSLKFGPRIDYTYINYSKSNQLNTFNYGFALGGGLNYQFKEHFNLHADYTFNWFAKDLFSASYDTAGASHTINYPAISIKRNMSIMIGFGYIF